MGLLFGDFKTGQVFLTPRRTITEADIGAFAGLTGDWNPVHTDAVFAAQTPFGAPIAHGPMLVGIAFGLLSRLDVIDGTVEALLSIGWDFAGPVRIGDTVRIRAVVTETRPTRQPGRGIVVMAMTVENQSGEAVQEGRATLLMRSQPHLAAAWGRTDPP